MDNGRVRRMGWTYSVLGAAAAVFTMCAVVARLVQLEDPEQQSDEADYEAMEMSDEAVLLILWGGVWWMWQVLVAMVAVAATHRVSSVLARLLSLSNAWILAAVLAGAVGRGHLEAIYRYVLFTGYGTVPLTFRLFFSAGLLIALFR